MTAARSKAGVGRRHWLFLAALGLCAAAWVANLAFAELKTGGAWSIGYGAAALVLMIVAGAYGLRRRAMSVSSRRRLGNANAWLSLHTYGGSLFLLLVLMHSGFGLPSGWVTWGLWILSLWTVFSGFVGLGLQRWIPRLLTSGLSEEVHFDRVPEIVVSLAERAHKLAAASPDAVKELYERRVADEMAAPRRRWLYFADITGGMQANLREFRYLGRFLSAEESEQLNELESLYRAKLEMDAHYTLQLPLRLWLYAHLPVTCLLFGFLVLHLVSVFLY